MTVPSKLMETTAQEFAAEGYSTRVYSVQTDNRGSNTTAQVVTLVFEKTEETKE